MALLLLIAPPLIAATPAGAQAAGGIQVAPVMVTMSTARNVASLRLHNGRDRAVSFEVDAFTWTQSNGEDVLTPTQELIVAPGVFEIPAGADQVVRLGATAPVQSVERAYRISMRELPSPLPGGDVLGFVLEMSLPVFVTEAGAHPSVEMQTSLQNGDAALILRNTGAAHTQIVSLTDARVGALHAPRYLLAGATATIALPSGAGTLHLSATAANGAPTDHVIHVERQSGDHSG